MKFATGSLAWTAVGLLGAAGYVRGDLISASAGLAVRSSFAGGLPAAADQAPPSLRVSVPELLARASTYWEGLYLSEAEGSAALQGLSRLLGGALGLSSAGFVWLASGDGPGKPAEPLVSQSVLQGRAGAEGAYGSSGVFRLPGAPGAMPLTREERRLMLRLEHKEPWSRTAAGLYSGVLGVSLVAIVIVFWIRDQMRAEAERTGPAQGS